MTYKFTKIGKGRRLGKRVNKKFIPIKPPAKDTSRNWQNSLESEMQEQEFMDLLNRVKNDPGFKIKIKSPKEPAFTIKVKTKEKVAEWEKLRTALYLYKGSKLGDVHEGSLFINQLYGYRLKNIKILLRRHGMQLRILIKPAIDYDYCPEHITFVVDETGNLMNYYY